MPLSAYIDESGGRAHTKKSTDHFVMAAVAFRNVHRPQVAGLLAQLRQDLGRHPGDELHWVNLKSHPQRVHVAQVLGHSDFLSISSVVVCKRHFEPGDEIHHEDVSYLYTLRFLVERLSWFGRNHGGAVDFTLAHIVRFPIAKLRSYEAILRGDPTCKVRWPYIAGPGKIDQPNRVEELQLADLCASAIAAAFEPDAFGNTERRYLEEMLPQFYRYKGNLTSYGLKMHPWNATAKAAYPWVLAL